MEIQYLGTAAAEGWPALFCDCDICRRARAAGGKDLRTRTQSMIDGTILIDFPPDTYTHALNYTLNLGQIQHLLITHSHMDHFFPVELIHRHEHFGHNARGMLHVYGNEAVEKAFYDAVLIDRFKVHPLDNSLCRCCDLAAEVGEGSQALLSTVGTCLLYGHDTGMNLSGEAWECIYSHKYSLISMDATMGKQKTEGYHMGLWDDVEFARRLEEKGCIDGNTVKVINHFSHNGGMTHKDLEAFAGEHGMMAAYDGMKVEV